MAHICHAHDCKTPVAPRLLMCRKHWFSLTQKTRDAIWREYRRGQEEDKRPSLRYLAVQAFAVAETAFRPFDETAALAAAGYLSRATAIAAQCVDRGLGNPLEGLVVKGAP